MKLSLYQVDAFTGSIFKGNPAAVCPLSAWLPDETLQSIAQENNLSETAFFTGGGGRYELRWFTPSTEVDLCGHATLASAFVLYNQLGETSPTLSFQTKSGELKVEQRGTSLAMTFPADVPEPVEAPPQQLIDAMGRVPIHVYGAKDWLLHYETIEEVAFLKPDFRALQGLPLRGVIATAPGENGLDFVSRWFGPNVGVDEDPVTGSAHCILAPFWAKRLNKVELRAEQISARGGELLCRYLPAADCVELEGTAVLYLTGELYL